jgi:hypothetical protein
LDHGNLSFGIAFYNDSRRTANVGIENISVQFGSAPVKVFTRDDLERKAENRAMWASIAVAVAGGVAAGAAASQRDTYQGTMVTPHGTYQSYWSGPSSAGQIQAAALAAGTGYGIVSINNQLDNTLQALGEEVIQLTTFDPGRSYAGRVVIDKIRPKTLPAQVSLSITWNGETYPFTFQIAKPGTPAPVFTERTRTSDLIDFREHSPTAPSESLSAAAPAEAGRDIDLLAKKSDAKPVSATPAAALIVPTEAASTAVAIAPIATTPIVAVAPTEAALTATAPTVAIAPVAPVAPVASSLSSLGENLTPVTTGIKAVAQNGSLTAEAIPQSDAAVAAKPKNRRQRRSRQR